jgi:hypothetical protein
MDGEEERKIKQEDKQVNRKNQRSTVGVNGSDREASRAALRIFHDRDSADAAKRR